MARWLSVTVAAGTLIVPAAAAATADLPTRTAEWLRSLGIPAPANPRVMVIGEGWGAEGIALTPNIIGVRRENMDPLLDGGAGEVLLHDLIHLAGIADEGITQAVTLDLLPAWTRRFPMRGSILVGFGSVYMGRVRAVRQESARVCGCPWTSRDARLWRRALLTR